MPRAYAASPFRNAANRCCCTLPAWRENTRQNKSRGLPCENICDRAECREPMPCRTGRASSVTAELQETVHHEPTGCVVMNNPLHILQTLDRHLTKAAEITIFGRAAL